MAGIRVRHPRYRNCSITIVDSDRPYTVPFSCPECGYTHECKTYHLKLDHNGEVTVSRTVYERLRTLRGLPLRTVETERHPRPQVIGLGGPPLRPKTFIEDPKGVA